MRAWNCRARARATSISKIARCYDVAERAWLKRFLDGWLSRVPASVMAEAAE